MTITDEIRAAHEELEAAIQAARDAAEELTRLLDNDEADWDRGFYQAASAIDEAYAALPILEDLEEDNEEYCWDHGAYSGSTCPSCTPDE